VGSKETVFWIDATKFGGVARFINHSCEGNLCLEIIRVGKFHPHVGLFARRDLVAGEELSYDYHSIRTPKRKVPNGVGVPCLCGTASCRKYL